MKYLLKEQDGAWHIIEDDGEIQRLIAVVFERVHARIMCRKMNQYVEDLKERVGMQ